ncbi:MAG: hypothetical protein ACI8Z1_002430, partial [Candidatus Azotimanducaceae bacterium]
RRLRSGREPQHITVPGWMHHCDSGLIAVDRGYCAPDRLLAGFINSVKQINLFNRQSRLSYINSFNQKSESSLNGD